MGISSKHGKVETYNWILANKDSINTILDIGVGSGTYFNLLSPIKQFNWTGVEAWNEYIVKFNIKEKYNTIHNVDIREFNWDTVYDLIIAGDVLEHMSKQDAIKLVDTALTHTKTLIISIPIVHMPQEEINNNPFEVHVKDDWSHTEVMETWGKYIKDSWIPKGKKINVGVYWLSL